ncbi:hypothetical protein LMG24238_06936 [Paraburkholderia sediminicola]|uniref:Uncharacterized protein n=2 Tax=Paraburkholderia sediminicola TaxID=458836 RepID=A0A6J5CP62_9BURK|nr:hypothetical protein LMG24238_06936 [Paraburkholderia sediminicola]
MRPVPVHLPDEALEPVCRAMGLPAPQDLPPPMRAVVNAHAHALRNPSPRVRSVSRARPASGGQASLGFDENCVDIKRRAANDIDED